MRVAIIGASRGTGREVSQLLMDRGDSVVLLARERQALALPKGSTTSVVDLKMASAADLAKTLAGSEAVVFAAGADPRSAHVTTLDGEGAVRSIRAAEQAEVRRFIHLSAKGVTGARPRYLQGNIWATVLRRQTTS
jgi:uncharacterized protein YbjT (DUF2867 family)